MPYGTKRKAGKYQTRLAYPVALYIIGVPDLRYGVVCICTAPDLLVYLYSWPGGRTLSSPNINPLQLT